MGKPALGSQDRLQLAVLAAGPSCPSIAQSRAAGARGSAPAACADRAAGRKHPAIGMPHRPRA
eukprot:363937-Chlamydomonas_euryale.AAC.10